MAVIKMAAADKDAVGTVIKGFENKFKVDPAGAHHPDDP
jgi:hypothetical protein